MDRNRHYKEWKPDKIKRRVTERNKEVGKTAAPLAKEKIEDEFFNDKECP